MLRRALGCRAMAYDRDLADQVRAVIDDESVAEKTMFGGLAFLVGGNMSVAASGQGGLLVRVDPSVTDELRPSLARRCSRWADAGR